MIEFNITQNILVDSFPVLRIIIDKVSTFEHPEKVLENYRTFEIDTFVTVRSELFMDNTEAIRAAAIINIIMIIIILVFFFLIVFIIQYDVNTKFKNIFDDIIQRVESISKKMGVNLSSDALVKDPLKYYSDLLTRMRDKAETETTRRKKKENKRYQRSQEKESIIDC